MKNIRVIPFGFALVVTLLFVVMLPVHAGPPPMCNGMPATIFVSGGFIVGGPDNGLAYAGVLTGSSGADVMVGTPVKDKILGRGGPDVICGGDGNDVLKGNGGKDSVYGEEGNDKLICKTGDIACVGGAGEDIIIYR